MDRNIAIEKIASSFIKPNSTKILRNQQFQQLLNDPDFVKDLKNQVGVLAFENSVKDLSETEILLLLQYGNFTVGSLIRLLDISLEQQYQSGFNAVLQRIVESKKSKVGSKKNTIIERYYKSKKIGLYDPITSALFEKLFIFLDLESIPIIDDLERINF